MNVSDVPALRDIVLLGGGHANVQVLKRFGMRPEPGVRLTIVAREPHSPYSGMLPGLVAGVYAWDDIHIDLARLAAFAGARFIAAEATGLDLGGRQITFDARPPLRYDVLAINTGGVPGEDFASSFVTPVKPIGRFLPVWRDLVEGPDRPRHLTVVGAGAGGVELALAIHHRTGMACTVLESGSEPLPGLAAAARRRFSKVIDDRGIELLTRFEVTNADAGSVWAKDGRHLQTDHVLWVTGVEAPAWPAQAGLATDANGFIAVNDALQSVSHPGVFAAGDVAGPVGQPRPKSGVYAVRQGPTLAANVRRQATGHPLRRFRAQRHALAIIGLGVGNALASRGRWAVSGPWVWRTKQWIDRRFIRKFNALPTMSQEAPKVAAALSGELPDPMRCGGCGAKLGADILRRVLDRLAVVTSPATVRGIGEDAALVRMVAGDIAVSCDGFRAMIDDPYRFGRIGAHHALNDLFAMGATPGFALALATVPAMADALMEEDLFQMMSGALSVFRDHGVDLVGGHSAEGAELGIAFSVTGTLEAEPLTKGGLGAGERLILTKPVGTGAVLAGAMQGRTRAADLVAAVDAMDCSNAVAVDVLRAHGATACTDVTGFGLAGHLAEMTRAAGGDVGARVDYDRVPKLPGALALIAEGRTSSLQDNNEQALRDFTILGALPGAAEIRILADPQTAGGLLASVAAAAADACVDELRRQGYPRATIIGEVVKGPSELRGTRASGPG